ncbi:MAG: Esterase/lipase [Marmoricola sp.]|nr:Esterase/lipase [Marmoricola sp.]
MRTIRPLEHLVPEGELGVKVTRRLLATMMAGAGTTPLGVEVVPVDSTTERLGRIKGEWLRPVTPRPGRVILYIHGSGYTLCSTRTHRPLVSRLARESRVTVFSAEYRLAPEHPFPAAPDDIERAYEWLLAQGWSPDNIAVVGDSAGGHLTLDLALRLLREGRELPAGLVMFSPLADVTCDLIAEREKVVPDPMISAAGVRKLFAHYLVGTDPTHPRLTHVVAPGEVLPPTLIQAGGAEFLAADAHHIADMLAAAGTDVRLEIWPGQMHVFQAANRLVPEADQALRRAARFVVDALDARVRTRESGDQEVTA